jgi:hypothetical protein
MGLTAGDRGWTIPFWDCDGGPRGERASFGALNFQRSLIIFEIMEYVLMLSALRLPVNKKAGLSAGLGARTCPFGKGRVKGSGTHCYGGEVILKQYAVTATPLRVVFHCRFAASCKACALIDDREKNLPPTTTA